MDIYSKLCPVNQGEDIESKKKFHRILSANISAIYFFANDASHIQSVHFRLIARTRHNIHLTLLNFFFFKNGNIAHFNQGFNSTPLLYTQFRHMPSFVVILKR